MIKKLFLLAGFILIFSAVNAEIGITYNSQTNTYDIYNSFHHYYIQNGIQWSNVPGEYWTQNLACFHVKPTSSSNWVKKCADELNMDWTIETDNSTYAKLKGYKHYIQGNYSFDLNLEYYLNDSMQKIRITPTITNTGNAVYDSFFRMIVHDIKIYNSQENNKIEIELNYIKENFDLNDGIERYYTYQDLTQNQFRLYNSVLGGETVTEWDEKGKKNGIEHSLQYDLRIAPLEGEYNNEVIARYKIGALSQGDSVTANWYWVDAMCSRSVSIQKTYYWAYTNDSNSVQCSYSRIGSGCGASDPISIDTNDSGSWNEISHSNSSGVYCVGCGGSAVGSLGTFTKNVFCGSNALGRHHIRCNLNNGTYSAIADFNCLSAPQPDTNYEWVNPNYFPDTPLDVNYNVNFDLNLNVGCMDADCGNMAVNLLYYTLPDCAGTEYYPSSSTELKLIYPATYNVLWHNVFKGKIIDVNYLLQPTAADKNYYLFLYWRYNCVGENCDQNVTSCNNQITVKGPPITTADNNSNWQAFNANIHLTCNDGNGSGCKETKYRKDSNPTKEANYGQWTTYDSNILFNQDGNLALQFYSTDNIGSIEETKTVYVLIDKTIHTEIIDKNYLPMPSNAAKNYTKTNDGNLVITYCYDSGYHLGDAYYIKSGNNGINWSTPTKINTTNNYCSGNYNETGLAPYRTGEGGITLAVNSLNDLYFLFTEWNGVNAWTRILYANQTWSNVTSIQANAGKSPSKDTANIAIDSNNSINYIITNRSQ